MIQYLKISLLLLIAASNLIARPPINLLNTSEKTPLPTTQTIIQKTIPFSESHASTFVDEKHYYVGPGDKLTAYIWGIQEEILPLTITNEGRILIPTVGSIEVGSRSLHELRILAEETIKQRYRAQQVDITLTEVKSIRVPVLGAVQQERFHTVSGSVTLSNLLKEVELSSTADIRNISIKNRARGDRSYDILAIKRKHPEAYDPYLFSGDIISIPFKRDYIEITGSVNIEGRISFLEGDKIRDLIHLSAGFSRGADSSRAIVSRFINNRDSLATIVVPYEEFEFFKLQRDDRVFIPAFTDYRVHRSVTITGEVNFPGTYPIRDDRTRLMEIIERAGGFTENAYLGGSQILRPNDFDAGYTEYFRLKNTPYSELSPEEKSYLKYRQTTSTAVVSINLDALQRDGSKRDPKDLRLVYDMILRDGDEIHIARRSLSVNVMGGVINPGLVDFRQGADFDYYVNAAGGYKTDARRRRAMIIKGGTGTWLRPREVDHISAGDAIWIPEKEYVDRMARTRDVLSILGGIATIVTASITVMAYVNNKDD